jgi:hypothetical protein
VFDPRIQYSTLDLTGSTGAKGTLNVANKWVKNCAANHERCQPESLPSPHQFIPTRLIDVGTTTEAPVRLCIRGEDPIGGPYVTLSYTGNTASVKGLRTCNIDEMRMSITQDDLPKIFKQAIQVARTLGVRYLWIDALCVVQDIPADKQREAALRGDIFSNSRCTIAATHAKLPDDGLFTLRNPFHYVRYVFMVDLSIRNKLQKYFLEDSCYFTSRVDDGPLCQEASFVQDRILCPRIIHFTRDMLFWECRQCTACDEYPVTLPFDQSKRTKPAIPRNLRINQTAMNPKQPDSHRFFWGGIVRRASQTNLKPEEDRLTQIAGIAERFSNMIHSHYVAGLFQCSLATDLLWQSESPAKSRRAASNGAPSWSWASLDGPVFPGSWITGEELVTLVEHDLVPSTRNHYGRLEKGELRISGRLYPARAIVHYDSSEISFTKNYEPSKNKIMLDELPDVPIYQQQAEFTVFVLPVVHCGQGRVPSRVGIALVPAEDRPQGHYRRIGSYRAAYPDKAEAILGVCPTEVSQHDSWYEEGKAKDYILCII